ncbi:MAG: hypothetical protein LBH20_06480 [Treponema sp.]|jgi:hypothetical protein|nr:hypothetical protein [Treponema sp.]
MRTVALSLILIAAFPLFAETDLKSETLFNLAITSVPEAKFTFTQNFTLPLLQGDNPLVKDNNIKFGLSAELTPISMNFLGDIVFTPAAFSELSVGGMLGSGWIISLFGSKLYGVGLNRPDEHNLTSVDGSDFDGLFAKGHFGGALQFDLAALIPGEWNHVVFRTYHEIGYKMYSRAEKGVPWFFEYDYGENQNGWNYYGSYLIGYRMPIILDTVALLTEIDKYLYDTPGGDRWGDSLGRWTLSLLFNFAFSENFSAALAAQFRTFRNYTNYTYGDKDDLFYRYRILDSGNPRTLTFYRAALLLNYRLGTNGE